MAASENPSIDGLRGTTGAKRSSTRQKIPSPQSAQKDSTRKPTSQSQSTSAAKKKWLSSQSNERVLMLRLSEQLVGPRLRELREGTGVSLRQIARELQVSASYLSQLETGKTQPSVATLFAICGALHVSVEDLFPEHSAEDDKRQFATTSSGVTAIGELRFTEDGAAAPSELESPPVATAFEPVRSPLVRPSDRKTLVLDSGVIWERLTPATGAKSNFLFVRYAVGGSSTSDGKLIRHAGTEYWYVLRGVLEVVLGFETYRVSAGDAISFDSTTPHRLTNPGDTPAEAIWFDQDLENPHL